MPIDTETFFQAASISKPVSALAALHYVEQGKLDLDSEINDFLTSWKVPENEFTGAFVNIGGAGLKGEKIDN